MKRRLKNWIIRHLLRDWPRRRVNRIVDDALAPRTCRGLFSGMRYVDRSIGSSYAPKLLGTYEQELVPVFERLFDQDFDQFVDIGAAEGYYAVGAALKTDWPITAFEANPQTPLPQLAELNGVTGRIDLRGACDLGELADLLAGKTNSLLLADVEGAERLLLDPRFIPELRTATLVVEVHDCFLLGTGGTLLRRFADSHRAERIDSVPRTGADCPLHFPPLPFDPTVYALEYLNERRPSGMYWLIFTPKAAR